MKVIYIDDEGLRWEIQGKKNQKYLQCIDKELDLPIKYISKMDIAILETNR